jgi:hypothetical protein
VCSGPQFSNRRATRRAELRKDVSETRRARLDGTEHCSARKLAAAVCPYLRSDTLEKHDTREAEQATAEEH